MKRRVFVLFLFIPAFLAAQAVPGREVRIGYYENAPKIYSGAGGLPAGFHADLVKILATDLDWNPVWVHGTWSECLARLESGEIDMMVDVAYSRARADRFYFNRESLFSNWAVIYTTPGKRIDGFYDLQGEKVATLENSIHTDGPMGILSLAREFKLDFTPVMVGSYDEAFDMLSRGDVDAAVVNRIFGVANESQFDVSRTTIIFDPVEIYFAFPRDTALLPLISEIDGELTALKSNPESRYYTLMDEYLAGAVRRETVVPPWLIAAFIVSLALISVMLAVGILLYREIRRRRASETSLRNYQDRLVQAAQQSYLGRLVYSMAHEINTPLGNGLISLTGARDLIREKLDRDLPLSSSDMNLLLGYLEHGEGSLKRLGLLTERFKEIGQNVDGTAVTIDVLNSLQDILGFFSQEFQRRGIRVNIDAPEQTLWTIHRGALRVVLSQLIQNSLDHAVAEGEGELKISLTVRLSEHTPKLWSLEYTDNGPGIDRERRNSSLIPFTPPGGGLDIWDWGCT